MHPWKPWLVLTVLAAFASPAAVVYKWTDSNGVVHYSDQPAPGAEKIVTSSSTAGSSTGPRPAPANSPPAASPQSSGQVRGLGYTIFSITAPTADQTYFGDDVVSASLALSPGLQPGHTITWQLNGAAVSDPGTSTNITLPPLERGSYVISAIVTDQATGASLSADNVAFFVRQPSIAAPTVQHHQ
jgi:hypothetical protein